MDQTDWKLLKILQQEKSMVKAAERLFISQPAISYRLTFQSVWSTSGPLLSLRRGIYKICLYLIQ